MFKYFGSKYFQNDIITNILNKIFKEIFLSNIVKVFGKVSNMLCGS